MKKLVERARRAEEGDLKQGIDESLGKLLWAAAAEARLRFPVVLVPAGTDIASKSIALNITSRCWRIV